jgi:hypothetical protein
MKRAVRECRVGQDQDPDTKGKREPSTAAGVTESEERVRRGGRLPKCVRFRDWYLT